VVWAGQQQCGQSRATAAARVSNDRQTNERTDGCRYRVKPPVLRRGFNNVTTYVESSELWLLGFLDMDVDWCCVLQMNVNRRFGSVFATNFHRVLWSTRNKNNNCINKAQTCHMTGLYRAFQAFSCSKIITAVVNAARPS